MTEIIWNPTWATWTPYNHKRLGKALHRWWREFPPEQRPRKKKRKLKKKWKVKLSSEMDGYHFMVDEVIDTSSPM